jgi:hypothetical protein
MTSHSVSQGGGVAQETTIESATDKERLREFVHFPWRIYKDDLLWVPPLVKEQLVMFSPGYHFFEHGEMELFLARWGNETVGRVAAILDRSYVDFSRDEAVFFGFVFLSLSTTQRLSRRSLTPLEPGEWNGG